MKNILKRLKNVYRFNRSNVSITEEEMKELLKSNDNIILLDVRSPQEYEEDHLPGAINIPNYELYYKVPRMIKQKDSIIIAYCNFGIRSKKAIKILKKMGYYNLYQLDL